MIIDSGIATSSLSVSGSFTVATGSSIEFQVINTGVKIGNIITDIHPVTGSLTVSGSITGSLLGTASFSTTASFALNAGGASGDKITTGSITASVDVGTTTFRIISGSSTFLFVSSSGNVGIGTTTPAFKLDITGSSRAQYKTAAVTESTFIFGDNLAAFTGTGRTKLTVGNTSGNSEFIVGQSNVNSILFSWAYNATTASAYGVLETYAGNNPLVLQSVGGNVGVGVTSPAAKLQVSGTTNVANVKGSGSATTPTIFTVDGAAGRLFSVNDSLSGSLFSVNTIAGLPVMEAFSDNTVRIGQYGQRALYVSQSRVGIGKETALNALLDVSGSVVITGSLNLTGSSTLIGNTVVTGSFTVFSGSSTELQVTNIGVNIGNIVTDTHTVTGSLNVSGSITGSLLGTASFATTASFALNAGAGGGSTAITFNRQTTGSYTLALTDAGKIVEMNTGSANVVTVPSSSVVNFTTGSQITVVQYGAGQTSFASGSTNVTIRSANNWLKINARYGAATLTKVGNDEWYLIGNLNA